ncbi:MAG TPA: hypothetical protein VLS89_00585, partial [Candidatus Nanopelagicales bacterium]|nr:hypothetical protein [Candidatus Nanopelagicales bacterium]
MKARRDFHPLGAALVLGLCSLACAAACGGSGEGALESPDPLLSASNAAQVELRRLLQRFAAASPDERTALEPDLIAFRARHPRDPLVRVADAHLAWIALEEGRLRHAESLAAQLMAGPPGATRDLAQVVRGATLRRSGRPADAFAALRPLVGKLIDSYARSLLNQEVVTAATESGAFRAAIELADVWLRDVPDDERPAARARITELLQRIPRAELARALRERQAAQPEDIPPSELLLRTLLA